MADFILCFAPTNRLGDLTDFLRQPYHPRTPTGATLLRPWGGFGILADPCAHGQNLPGSETVAVGWVGDLPEPHRTPVLKQLIACATKVEEAGGFEALASELLKTNCLDRLNGASAVALIGSTGACVITDPFSAVQVYSGTDREGNLAAVGTHPDLVARAASDEDHIDPVSVSDFINTGTPCWPYTMHTHVRELAPGSIHVFAPNKAGRIAHTCRAYWTPPCAEKAAAREADLAQEFSHAWTAAVADRCSGSRIAVQLSGGLDSRLVMAAVPASKDCVGLTLCDTLNREALIARDVAQAYGRSWETLQRDEEYVGRTALDSIRFTGCEGEWHHAHSIGFTDSIAAMGIDTVFTGLFMDNNFKGYYAKDVIRVPRLGGLLAATHRIGTLDYVNQIHPTCTQYVCAEAVEGSRQRRRELAESHFARQRQSPWEWLDGYPLTQASDNTGWIVERRVFPLRLPVMDRRLVDLAFRVPMLWKADNRFFLKSATRVFGPGNRIPNANNGVAPGSGHMAYLWQRGKRKLQTRARRALKSLGMKFPVPHSWHDYQTYWAESRILRDLVAAHGNRLRLFEGKALKPGAEALLQRKELPWRPALRLLQLAVWRSVITSYKSPAACSRISASGEISTTTTAALKA